MNIPAKHNTNKAVFLDRDGVVNRERGDYVWKKDDFVFNADIFEALREFQERGYQLFIITNQSGIAKGRYAHEDVAALHDHMLTGLSLEGITITDIFYCPHHDELGRCLCRKPGSLLIEKALAKYAIDSKRSFLIGDRDRDIQAGERAGVRGVRIESNTPLLDAVDI